MSINLQVFSSQERIDILGEFKTSADEVSVLQAIDQLNTQQALKIAFYDALTLPRSLIEVLCTQQQMGRDLRIDTYQVYLTHILLNLSLPAVYVPQKTLHKPISVLKALVIGGSCEQIDNMIYLLEHLPIGEHSIFVVQHLSKAAESNLDRLLKIRTDYQIYLPNQLQKIRTQAIYVVPPDFHLKIAHGLMYLTRDAKVNLERPSIDVVFKTLAHEYGKSLLGILLCGKSHDGIIGAQALQSVGATVLIEKDQTCPAPEFMDKVLRMGCFDYTMGIREIACFSASALRGKHSDLNEALINLLLDAIYARYGYDYRGYQYDTVKRRIQKLMQALNIESFHCFQRQLLNDPSVFQRFYLDMSVEVTGFFRHPSQFKYLREQVLPVLKQQPHLKIWSAGCASGEEIYSLALLLDEMNLLDKSQLFATDINRFAIAQAKTGLFPRQNLADNQKNYRASGGLQRFSDYAKDNGHYLKMPKQYRDNILFHQHSLTHDGVLNQFQLIFCRNVLIYFKDQQQQHVMKHFYKALHPQGLLILGQHENLSLGKGERYFKTLNHQERIYQRR